MSVAIGLAVVVERSTPMRGAVELVVHHPPAAAAVKPGQFFQLAVAAPQTILRRPYSAAWADPQSGRIGFIFNVVGAGSGWLAVRHEGHELDLLGPLGRGFDLDRTGPAIIVAGGLGVAVFPGVVRALVGRGRHVTVLLGARTSAQLLPADRFPGAEVMTATDDGSAGYHGSVVDLLASARGEGPEIFSCGPTSMLQALVERTRRLEVPLRSIQVSLESPMGCGVGTCLGCAIPRPGSGYLLTCLDGPCLAADRINWDRITDTFHG
ncbi:MAG: dihydroorotate dehydrogenase electron transfer subunit [Chloroflexi bacterium]|nr:MAG: dihydroorotate dehydrogenase electron transfer subunit [Chloroflexota bacterium]